MDRRGFLKTSALAVGAAQLGALGETQAATAAGAAARWGEQPNVVFILTDQHNAKVMGHQGHATVQTPHLDRMAAEGVRFDNCTTANCICTPSRVSFLSGQYCHNHGYYGLSGPNPRGLPSVLGYFRRAGYRTAAIGKIHCPENWIENDSDVFHDTCGTSIGGVSAAYTAYLESKGVADLEDTVALKEFGKKGVQTVDARASKVAWEDSQDGWATGQAIDFMRASAARRQPFFVHLSMPRPHQCYTPAQEFWDLYDQDALALPPNADGDLKLKPPNLVKTVDYWRKGEWTLFEPKTYEAGRRRKLHGYLGCVSHVDHGVGRVMAFLREQGLAENTIVVYSTDHGDYACEHGVMEKAPGIGSDAITRVPMIWWMPGRLRAGHVVRDVVETVDLAPTLCALAGLDPLQTADGLDLSDVLRGAAAPADRAGLTEFAWSKSLRQGPWRLVVYPRAMFAEDYPDGFGELYNLDDDPWEMRNRYFEAGCADVVRKLKDALHEKLVTTTRPTTIHGSNVLEPPPGPQASEHYHHVVNADNKMHYDRVAAAATQRWSDNYN